MLFIVLMNQKLKTEIVLTASQDKQKIGSGDLNHRQIGEAIQVWKILIQSSYRYEWTVTDVM